MVSKTLDVAYCLLSFSYYYCFEQRYFLSDVSSVILACESIHTVLNNRDPKPLTVTEY